MIDSCRLRPKSQSAAYFAECSGVAAAPCAAHESAQIRGNINLDLRAPRFAARPFAQAAERVGVRRKFPAQLTPSSARRKRGLWGFSVRRVAIARARESNQGDRC